MYFRETVVPENMFMFLKEKISFLVLTIRLTTINNIINNIKLKTVKNDHSGNFERVCAPKSMILT